MYRRHTFAGTKKMCYREKRFFLRTGRGFLK